MNPSSRRSGSGETRSKVLWEDGERTLRRSWRNGADGGRYTVLEVVSVVEHATLGPINRLIHEYELKDDLNEAWAAQPLELVRERGEIMLVLKDPGASYLIALSAILWKSKHSSASLSQ